MLLILVGTARAGEGLTPPAPMQEPSPSTIEVPSGGETLDAGTTTFELPDTLAKVALDLLKILPALV
jgi:hypothetical protein